MQKWFDASVMEPFNATVHVICLQQKSSFITKAIVYKRRNKIFERSLKKTKPCQFSKSILVTKCDDYT